jgi:hypothetical protein
MSALAFLGVFQVTLFVTPSSKWFDIIELKFEGIEFWDTARWCYAMTAGVVFVTFPSK